MIVDCEFHGSLRLKREIAQTLADQGINAFATGWGEDDAPVIDDAVRALMVEAEKLTDALCIPAYSVLDDAERKALVAGVKAFEAALA